MHKTLDCDSWPQFTPWPINDSRYVMTVCPVRNDASICLCICLLRDVHMYVCLCVRVHVWLTDYGLNCLNQGELVTLIPHLEEVWEDVEAIQNEEGVRECVVCFEAGADDVGWVMWPQCGHVCVSIKCCTGLVECPKCRQVRFEFFPVFFWYFMPHKDVYSTWSY